MQKFTEDQIKRQDFVDNEIYDLVKRLIPSAREIEWNIEMIGDVRDTIQHWLADKYKIIDELEFIPDVSGRTLKRKVIQRGTEYISQTC